MADYQRPSFFPFFCAGISLASPVDRLKQGKYTRLKNVTIVREGEIEPRPGIVDKYAVAGNKTPVHSIKRLNDSSDGTEKWALFYGVQDEVHAELSSAPGTVTSYDSGYPATPLSMLTYSPPLSPQSWLYVGSSTRMRKFNVAGTGHHSIGLPAPLTMPTAAISSLWFKDVDQMGALAGWAAGGTNPPTITGLVAGKRVNTTVTASIVDNFAAGTAGVACVRPAAISNISPGLVIPGVAMNSGATATLFVLGVYRGSTAFTISSIIYDSGTTGRAAFVPSVPLREIVVNTMLLNSTRGTYARVADVSYGPKGSMSIIVHTTGAAWAATDTVQAVDSFTTFSFDAGTVASDRPAAGATLAVEALHITTASGNGYIEKTVAVDLSTISPVNGAASALDDYMSICFRISAPETLVQIDVELSLLDTSFNDKYIRSITPSDLTAYLKGQQTAIDARDKQINRRQAGDPPFVSKIGRRVDATRREIRNEFGGGLGGRPADPFYGGGTDPSGVDIAPPDDTGQPREQLPPGDLTWTFARFPLSSMQRVGNSPASFKDVQKVRITFYTSGTPIIFISSWSVFGGDQPDTYFTEPYRYRYRGRVSSTGVVSDWSEPSNPIDPVRQLVTVKYTAHPSTECDKLDIERFGGAVPLWGYIATVANTTSVLLDRTSDIGQLTGVTQDTDTTPNLQPFVVPTRPVTGTCTIVAGTTIKSSAAFDTAWPDGTLIIVDGVPTTITRVPTTSIAHVAEALPAATNVTFEVPNPRKVGQPLPVIGGPWFEHIFGFGDPLNPGLWYFLKRGGESMAARHWMEVCDPSETLMNYLLYNGRLVLFTNRRQFIAEYTEGQEPPFSFSEIPSSKGLASRWALAVGVRGMAFLSDDGIYLSSGGASRNITSDDLGPLFPNNSRTGADVNTISAPKLGSTEESYLRLWFADDNSLMFAYRNASNAFCCLRYEIDKERWLPYEFQKSITCGYAEEGKNVRNHLLGGADATRAHVYTLGGAENGTDAATTIPCSFETAYEDFGDPRSRKQFGDVMFNLEAGGATVTVLVLFDNGTVTGPSKVVTTNGPHVIDLPGTAPDGSGAFYRNIGLRVTWTNAATQRPKLTVWQPSFIVIPEDTFKRATDADNAGTTDMKFVQGLRVRANTGGADKTVQVQYDSAAGWVDGPQLTINSASDAWIVFPRAGAGGAFAPFRAHHMRLICEDTEDWLLYQWEWLYQTEPETETTYFETQETTFDHRSYGHIREVWIAYRSTATVTLAVYADVASVSGIPTLPSTAGAYAKVRVMIPANKAKAFKFVLSSSAGFSLYLRDCSVLYKPWSFDGDYLPMNPFGEVSRDRGGARV